MTLNMLLFFLALVCFLVATVERLPFPRPINFTALGLFLWVLATVIERYGK